MGQESSWALGEAGHSQLLPPVGEGEEWLLLRVEWYSVGQISGCGNLLAGGQTLKADGHVQHLQCWGHEDIIYGSELESFPNLPASASKLSPSQSVVWNVAALLFLQEATGCA